MSIERTEFQKAAKAGVAFLVCFLAGFPISHMLAFSRWYSPQSHFLVWFFNRIWFYPQDVLPPGFQVVSAGGVCDEVISPPTAMFLSVLFWTVIGLAFAWLTRRFRLSFTLPLAAVVIFLAMMTAISVLGIFGIEAEISGP